jgi:hypothetical protein
LNEPPGSSKIAFVVVTPDPPIVMFPVLVNGAAMVSWMVLVEVVERRLLPEEGQVWEPLIGIPE